MNEPPSYPRIPHLSPGRGTADDELLAPAQADKLLHRPVIVEEKLDGANVSVWLDDSSAIECALRSGLGSQDRARQLGPLRGWLSPRSDRLRELLVGRVLYAEWLLNTHTVHYDALPSYLVGLDVWTGSRFVSPDERNELLERAHLPTPPELFRGTLGNAERLHELLGRSRFGTAQMEGVVIRTLDGAEPAVSKLLRPGFERISDVDWRKGRPRNLLLERELSWR